jgi:hypothetical protein
VEAIGGVKIFKFADVNEWYVGKDPEDARQGMANHLGDDTASDYEVEEFVEISEADLDKLNFIDQSFENIKDPDVDEPEVIKLTFRERLEFMVEDKEVTFPCFFASEEW